MGKIIYAAVCILLLVACTGTKWTTKPASYQNARIMMAPVDTSTIRIHPALLHPEVFSEIRLSHADSLASLSLLRVIQSPQLRAQGVTTTDSYRMADYILTVEELKIRRYPTLNVVRPGPNYRIDLTISVKRGTSPVMKGRFTTYGNLASEASSLVGFYFPSASERNDPALQQKTLHKALYTAMGDAWMHFFQLE